MTEITFLGTSDAIPSKERNHTSILLSHDSENILVDCGEGTQRQMRIAGINPNKITRLLITHWHGDHVLGIPGLLQTLSFSEYNKTLFIYGPRGTKEFMKKMLETFAFQQNFKIEAEEINSGKFFESDDFYIEAEKMDHGTPCNAYNIVVKDSLRIDKKKLEKAKIFGPVVGELKKGKNVEFNGTKFFSKDFTYKEKGKKISFILDTSFNDRIIPFAKKANLLICESTFGDDLIDKAKEYKHLNVSRVAEIAKKANAEKLILTHVSSRYVKDKKIILDSAKKVFKNSVLAKDFDKFKV